MTKRPEPAFPEFDFAPGDSAEMFRSFAALTTDAILIHRDWRIEFVNPVAARMFGAAHAESLLGREVLSLIHPLSRKLSRERVARLYAGERVLPAEMTMTTLDGGAFPAELHAAPVTLGGAPAVLSLVRDVTQRRREQRLVEEQRRILESLALNAPRDTVLAELVRLVELDIEGCIASVLLADEEGRWLHHGAATNLPREYNRAVDGIAIGEGVGSCGTAAYRREPVIVSDIAIDPLWKDFRELALAHGLHACWSLPIFGSGDAVMGTFAVYFRRPRAPMERELAAIQDAVSIATVALEHWQASRQLERRETQLDLAAAAVRMGVWYLDLPAGRAHCSDGIGPLFGLPAGSQIGSRREFVAWVHPEDRTRVRRLLRRALKQGEDYAPEFRVVWDDGSVHWIATRGMVERDDKGRPMRMMGVDMDITERRLLEQRLAERQMELERLARLDIVHSMGTALAHEINQPLAAVTYSLGAALNHARAGRGTQATMVRDLETALEQTGRAAGVARRIMEFSRRRLPRRERLDIESALAAAAEMAGPEARRRHVPIRIERLREPLFAEADPLQIELVLLNLIRNGLEAMHGRDFERRRLVLRARRAADGLIEIAVSDRGRGLNGADPAKLFEPLVSGRRGGTGLGLALCRDIVEAHGGHIRLEANRRGGATAVFALAEAQPARP